MLERRIISALVALAGFAAILWFSGPSGFAFFTCVLVAAGALEWARLSGVRSDLAQSLYAGLVGLATLLLINATMPASWLAWLLLAGLLLWMLMVACLVVQPQARSITRPAIGWLVLGVAVLLLAGIGVHALRHSVSGAGNGLLLFVLGIVWCADTGAYFSGRRFGRSKLAALISPGKTLEGAAGGLAVVLVLLLVFLSFSGWPAGEGLALVLGTLFAALFSIAGDLVESRLKRASGFKDSGDLMPGHGGVLDRIDGVVAAVPVFLFFWIWLTGGPA